MLVTMRNISFIVVLTVIGLCIVVIGVLSIIKQKASVDLPSTQNNPSNLEKVVSKITITPTPTPPYNIIRKANISEIRTALELYRSDKRRYPDTLKELVPIYLVETRLDPVHKSEYSYKVDQSKLDYALSVRMDDDTTYTTHAP